MSTMNAYELIRLTAYLSAELTVYPEDEAPEGTLADTMILMTWRAVETGFAVMYEAVLHANGDAKLLRSVFDQDIENEILPVLEIEGNYLETVKADLEKLRDELV